MTSKPSISSGDLPSRSEPQWTGIVLDDGFTDTFCVLGERILVSRPQGRATRLGLERAFDVVHEVIAETMPPTGSFIWIADYSALQNSTRTTRRRFARRMAEFTRMHSLILCGLPPAMRVAARMARLIRLIETRIHVVDSFEAGLELATTILDGFDDSQLVAVEGEVESSPDWHLELDGLSVDWRIVDGNEVHGSFAGDIKRQHVDPVLDLLTEIISDHLSDHDGNQEPYFLVSDLSGLKRIGYRARRYYVDRLTALYQEMPFRMEVGYGASHVLRAAFNLSRAFAPFEAVVVEDEAAVRRVLASARSSQTDSRSSGRPGTGGNRPDSADLNSYADQLVKALGAVTWGVEQDVVGVGPENPFRSVHEAIELLREDLDEILAERAQLADEQRLLERRLERAEKMEALGLLAAGVAHDLNNALTGVVTYPEVLLMDPNLPEEAREILRTVHEYGKGAQAVVSDLVSATGGMVDSRIRLDVAQTVESIVAGERVRAAADQRGVQVSLDVVDGPLLVSASPARLWKVVENLAEAAVLAAPKKTGLVKVAVQTFCADQASHRLEELPEGEYILLTVTDNGPDVPEADREHLFEPFYAKKKLGRGGTGLGLTAVWSSVHDDGGTVDVHSHDGETRIEVFLPLSREEADAAADTDVNGFPAGSGVRILVVDDVEVQREVACTILRSLGYCAEAVASGEEAIAVLKEQAADLVVLDMIMEPGLNGHETLRCIRRFLPDLPAVVATGYCSEDDLEAAKSLGLTAVLRKPYTVKDLATVVSKGLLARTSQQSS